MISRVKRINLRNCNRQILDLTRNQSMIIQVTANLLTPDSHKALIRLPLLPYQSGVQVTISKLVVQLSVNYQILLSTKVLKKSQPSLFLQKSFLRLLISTEACMWESRLESRRRPRMLRKQQGQLKRKTHPRWSSFRKLKTSNRRGLTQS